MTEINAGTESTAVAAARNGPSEASPAAPAGNPAVLGLLVFALGSTVLGISLLGFVSAAGQGGSVLPIASAATGVVLLVTTIWAAVERETFVATVLGAFTGFWLSYTLLVLGLVHNWYGIPPADVSHAVAQFLIGWGIVVLMLDLISLRIPLVFTLILTDAVVAILLLIIAQFTGATSLDRVAGVLVLVFALLGYYAYLSTGWASVGGRPLPMGPPAAGLLSR